MGMQGAVWNLEMSSNQSLPDRGSVKVQRQAQLIATHMKKLWHHLARPAASLSRH